MSLVAVLKYMKSCCEDATVSAILTDLFNEGGLTIIELQWDLKGVSTAHALTEGHFYRSNRELQRVFNSVRDTLKSINQG